MGVKNYQDLLAWQKAMELAEICYNITRLFPREEMFGMTSQIRRSATSVPSNIAEGYGRGNNKEFNNFLRIARGSLSELETQILLSQRVGLINTDDAARTLEALNEVGRILRGLQKAVVLELR